MREGKRLVGNEEKFNVEIDRKFILVLRTQDKKNDLLFFLSSSKFHVQLFSNLQAYPLYSPTIVADTRVREGRGGGRH